VAAINIFRNNHQTSGFLFAGVGTALFSCKGILIKLCYQQGASPDMVMALRMLFSLPFYLAIAFMAYPAAASKLNKKYFFQIALFGVSGYYIASILDVYGLQYLSASMERIVLYTYPTMVFLLSIVFLNVGFNRMIAIYIAIIYAGLLLVFLKHGLEMDTAVLHGGLLVLASAFFYSLYLIGTEKITKVIPNRFFTAFAMLSACVLMCVHITVRVSFSALAHQSSYIYLLCFLIAIFCTVIPSFMVSAGVQRIGATKAGAMGNIGPLVTLVLGVTLLGETITPLQLLGFAIVMGGVYRLSQQK
jgi:drug/metabolite transporter (DMT)-like permease